ncbi:MAG: GTPase HflX [Candidatus Omnitrophica bacterium]|nr:GTPase HflX [Candidatus Omnitrophota bacterium]MCM8817557.1 GTPase HflX [Candidatus Omnitrophota bacterium]
MLRPNVLTGGDLSGKRVIIVSFHDRFSNNSEENLEELKSLAHTLEMDVVKSVIVRYPEPVHPATFLGRGKIQELARMVSEEKCDIVIFEKELTPVQQRNLESFMKVKVIDRTIMILFIFGRHAHTLEGKLQVELAQMTYLLPRLSSFYGNLSRLGGTIGTRGPGEQKLEIYRRRARERIRFLNMKIKEIEKHREIIRDSRQRKNFPLVALIGYTNVGKSTLLNALTHKNDAIVDNKLFSTLDPLTRLVYLGGKKFCLISDTVGLLYSLPHHLIAAFKATLEELRFSHLLVCLIDVINFSIEKQLKTIDEVLKILDLQEKPKIFVFNKIDLVDEGEINFLKNNYPDAIFISAKRGIGLDTLKLKISKVVEEHVYF